MKIKKVVAGLMALVCVSSFSVFNYQDIITNVEISAVETYYTRDPFYNFSSSYNYYTTEHFQFIWGNSGDSSRVTQQFLEGNGKNLEACWDVYMNELGMKAPSTSMYNGDTKNYKVNIYISGTGLSGFNDDWAYMSNDSDGYAYMFCCVDAMAYDTPSWVLPHEFGHVVTWHQGGWNDNKYTYAWYEAMGNWFREQFLYSDYYHSADTTGIGHYTDFFETYLKNMSLTSPCGRDYYASWALLQYLTENPDNLGNYGETFVKTMLQEGHTDEYPLKMIERLGGVDLKTTLGNFAKRLATLDFENQENYRARLDELFNSGSWNYQNIYTYLEESEIEDWYRVPTEKAPQQAGVNVVPLEIKDGSITVTLNGLTNVNGADWRACIVAEDTNGNSYYSNLFGDGETQTLKLPSNVSSAYLTVVATPDTDTMVEVGLPYGEGSEFAEEYYSYQSKTRYPYEVKIEGATVQQRTIQEETGNWWNSYHRHSNGGGLVSDYATVDDTVYVGSNAKVLGSATVTGNVIIDDYAVVEGSAKVSGNAIIDGNAIISENATVKDNAYITDNAMVMGNSVINGNAKVIESALVFGNYKVSDNAIIKGMAYCMADGSASGQGMADGDYYDDGGKYITKGTAYGWVSSQNYVNSLSYTDGGYAKYEFNSDSSSIVEDTYTSTYGVAVNSPTWNKTKTSANGVLTFNGIDNYISLDRSLAYFTDAEYQTAILWRGDSGEIFSFGDDTNYMNLNISNDGVIKFNISKGGQVETITSNIVLTKGTWTTIELTLSNDTATLTLNDGNGNKTSTATVKTNPLDVARATDSNNFLFGSFNGSADYFRVSYKDSANDNSYYYTSKETITDDTDNKPITTETTTITTTPVMTTTTATTTTTNVTTTTPPSGSKNYISVTLNGNSINLDDYSNFDIIGITFDLTATSTGNGAVSCNSMSGWYSQSYTFENSSNVYVDLPKDAYGTLSLNMWWNSANANITNVRLVTSSTDSGITTTTTPVTTTTPITTTTPVTTTTSVTTTTPMTTTTPVTTTPITTTTKISTNNQYIPVTLNDATIKVSDYTSKKAVGITFKLTGVSTGSGSCQLLTTNNDWLGSVDYSYTDTDTVTIDLSKYSNIGIIKLYMWWNSNGQNITDVQLIVE
ncbi:MAG: DUF6055 domain-containing protein [Oscillospiraceae bacterium]